MKTSKIKTVRNIDRIRTLLVTLSVAVCLATLMGCGNSREENLREGAEAGDAMRQWLLGLSYHNGDGVPEDYAEAMKWFRKAAEQGHANAQYFLGFMYAAGRGVPEDDAEAVKWYRKAAEQGFADAQYNLGWMYANGAGVPEDDVAAYAWFSVAAASGDYNAPKKRDAIKRQLTPTQLEKGEALAREISERIKKRKAAEAE